MFKEVKQRFLSQNKLGNYLKYAVGEILLIVVGILVAVSINNSNEERKQEKVLQGIYATIMQDLKTDTAEIKNILKYYHEKESTFDRVIDDTLSKEEIEACKTCRYLITGRRLFTINKTGFQQLNDYKNIAQPRGDSLVFDIVNFYTVYNEEVATLNKLINSDIIENLTYWRDHYDWFAASTRGNLEAEDLAYFANHPEYKNRAAYHYTLVYENYLPVLQSFLRNAERILGEIILLS